MHRLMHCLRAQELQDLREVAAAVAVQAGVSDEGSGGSGGTDGDEKLSEAMGDFALDKVRVELSIAALGNVWNKMLLTSV
jgi:hypothetical protein